MWSELEEEFMLEALADFFYYNFIEVLEYDFYTTAIYASVLVSIATALMSIIIVNKNWAMLGMGLSNSVLPGVVIGSKFSFPLALTLGAFSTSLLCFYLTYFIVKYSRLKNDAALGMCYSCFLALGLLLLNFVETEAHITHILFGNLLGIPDNEYLELVIICCSIIAFFIVKYRDIMLFTFDELHFKIIGLKHQFFHNLILVLLTMTIVASLQAIGILLTISYLVLPAVTAQLLTKKLTLSVVIGIACNLFASYAGLSIGYIADIATGPSIVVVQTILFLFAYSYRRMSNSRTRRQRIMSTATPELTTAHL